MQRRYLDIHVFTPLSALVSITVLTALGLLIEPTAAMTPELKVAEEQRSTKTELSVDGILAKLEVAEPGLTFSIGGSAFVTLRLSNQSKSKSIGAEIVLESDVAELAFVTGKSVKAEGGKTAMTARVKGLRKGKKSRKVLVEVRLRAGEDAALIDGKSINRLKIALRKLNAKPDAETDQTTVVWPASDCAANFYKEISAIRDRNHDAMSTALKSGRSRDKTRPGRWLFRPGIAKSVRRRVCAQWRQVWKPFQGRYERTCIRRKTVTRTIRSSGNLPKSEAAVYRFATQFVSSRAIDRRLSVKQNEGWVSQRVATDLRGFLKQEKHPAICTGAPQMMDYFSTKLDAVRKRGSQISERAEEAAILAKAKFAEARSAIASDPSRTELPAAVDAKPDEAPSPSSLSEMVRALVADIGDESLISKVADTETVFDALKGVSGSLKAATKPLGKPAKSAIRNALSAIEAADYLSIVAGHYAEIDTTILGSLEQVRRAHKKECVCSG